MFIELVDLLRCPKPHEESWLVLSATLMAGRHVIEGELGCHICHAHYVIRNGVAVFSTARPVDAEADAIGPSADAGMRLAALLGLAEAGGVAMLVGTQSRLAPTLEMLAAETQLLTLNSSGALSEATGGGSISALQSQLPLPLAAGCCRAIAVDATHAHPAFLTEAVRVLRSGGRLVVPNGTQLPEGVTELARDETEIVAERREAPGTLIPIEVARRK